jgi:hypothetical protein
MLLAGQAARRAVVALSTFIVARYPRGVQQSVFVFAILKPKRNAEATAINI